MVNAKVFGFCHNLKPEKGSISLFLFMGPITMFLVLYLHNRGNLPSLDILTPKTRGIKLITQRNGDRNWTVHVYIISLYFRTSMFRAKRLPILDNVTRRQCHAFEGYLLSGGRGVVVRMSMWVKNSSNVCIECWWAQLIIHHDAVRNTRLVTASCVQHPFPQNS